MARTVATNYKGSCGAWTELRKSSTRRRRTAARAPRRQSASQSLPPSESEEARRRYRPGFPNRRLPGGIRGCSFGERMPSARPLCQAETSCRAAQTRTDYGRSGSGCRRSPAPRLRGFEGTGRSIQGRGTDRRGGRRAVRHRVAFRKRYCGKVRWVGPSTNSISAGPSRLADLTLSNTPNSSKPKTV